MTRNISIGHQGLLKFTCVMNMLPPMKENAYQDHAQALHDPAVRTAKEAAEDTAKKAAARTAKESMSRAADKVKELNKPDKEGTYNIAVSGDGTFIFRSGYCSLHSHWKGIGL